jgi:hypothetical protein
LSGGGEWNDMTFSVMHLCVWRQASQIIIFGDALHNNYNHLRIYYVKSLTVYGTGAVKNAEYSIRLCKLFSYYVLYLEHHATSRKVAGSSPDVADFSVDLILPAAIWPWGRLSL